MEILISKNLKKLATEFKKRNATLYIVGGYIRDALLNQNSKDIDICSHLSPNEVIKICDDIKFSSHIINKFLGTIQIKINKEVFEYTPFRLDNYKINNGSHTPDSVQFVDNLETDAFRRDITINTIYYDILNKQIIDIFNGINDLNNNIIKVINNENVLKSDSARILRIIRFASSIKKANKYFKIDSSTFKQMKDNTLLLKDLACERKIKELNSIFLKCEFNKKHNPIYYFNNLDLYKYLYNSALSKLKIKKNYYYNCFLNSSIEDKYFNYSLLILFNYIKCNFNFEHIEHIVNSLFKFDGIKESNDFCKDLTYSYFLIKNIYKKKSISYNVVSTYYNCNNKLKTVINTFCHKDMEYLQKVINNLKANEIPLSIKDLKINAQDLIKNKINEKSISKILEILYKLTVTMQLKNKKETLINQAIIIDQEMKKIVNLK